MSTTIMLQMNATDVAGDWATRSAGAACSGTGSLGGAPQRSERSSSDVAITLFDLRGAIESIRRGTHSPSLADSRTDAVQISYGSPLMYHGICFVVG